jgi:hypothetical protein
MLQLDLTKLDFCYSAVVKVFVNYLTSHDRPRIELMLGNQAWQVTSMKTLAGMSSYCTIVPGSDCPHTELYCKEDDFYAPTGSGSTVTTTFCKLCNMELAKHSVYND